MCRIQPRKSSRRRNLPRPRLHQPHPRPPIHPRQAHSTPPTPRLRIALARQSPRHQLIQLSLRRIPRKTGRDPPQMLQQHRHRQPFDNHRPPLHRLRSAPQCRQRMQKPRLNRQRMRPPIEQRQPLPRRPQTVLKLLIRRQTQRQQQMRLRICRQQRHRPHRLLHRIPQNPFDNNVAAFCCFSSPRVASGLRSTC